MSGQVRRHLGKPVVIENITGAAATSPAIAREISAHGYTLGMIGNSSLIFSPSLYANSVRPGQGFGADLAGIRRRQHSRRADPDVRRTACLSSSRWRAASPASSPTRHTGVGTRSISLRRAFSSHRRHRYPAVGYPARPRPPDLLAGRRQPRLRQYRHVAPLVQEGKLRALRDLRKRSALCPDLPTIPDPAIPARGGAVVRPDGRPAPGELDTSIARGPRCSRSRTCAGKRTTLPRRDRRHTAASSRPRSSAQTPRWASVIKQAGSERTKDEGHE